MNLKKKRKKHPIRNLFIASGCSAIVAYIGTQLNEASKRYELKQLSYDSDLYRLDKIEQEQPLDQPTQLYHEFRITEKATNEFLGTCKVYMGQEQTSYYEGHIHVLLNNPAKANCLPAIYTLLIQVAKERLMNHVYFVCDNKDNDSIRLFEMLGAKFNKSINIPEDHHLYSKQRKTRKQYKLELI